VRGLCVLRELHRREQKQSGGEARASSPQPARDVVHERKSNEAREQRGHKERDLD